MKLAAIGVGAGIVLVGAIGWIFGGHVTTALNVTYAKLPGHFQYPPNWHKLIGGMLIGFGLLIVVVGGVMAGR